MTSKRNVLLVVGMLSASLVGGALSHRLLSTRPAEAVEEQAQVGHPRWVRAVTFYLVDEDREGAQAVIAPGAGGLPFFELRDLTNSPRAKLQLVSGGQPELQLLDGDGSARITADLQGGTPSVKLVCNDGSAGVQLSAGNAPTVSLHDRSGRSRIELALDASGEPIIKLLAADGSVTWQAPPEDE